jgi:hypothetical protein
MYPPFQSRSVESVQDATPATGGNVAVSSDAGVLVISPSGSLASLTVTMPASPSNGRRVTICTTQAITVLTLAGGLFIGGVSTLALGGFASFCYVSSVGRWVRCG